MEECLGGLNICRVGKVQLKVGITDLQAVNQINFVITVRAGGNRMVTHGWSQICAVGHMDNTTIIDMVLEAPNMKAVTNMWTLLSIKTGGSK